MDKKNILLLFLSDVKVSKNGVVSPAIYKDIGETETTNESAVLYLANVKGAPPNKIFYFASQKVQSHIDGKKISHVDYFKNRIKKSVVGDIENIMEPCNFDENADIPKTMETVIKMASMIQEYVVSLPQETEVTLHVDMTGGMRHASLMMLVITRLLQYSGVKIGNILYSNYNRDRAEQFVEESDEIYKMFDLISGAEEFVRFGSVDAIQSYFKGKKVPQVLQNLLDAMNKFAEAIKISRRSEFQKALEELQNSYEKFSADADEITKSSDSAALNYNLMQQMKIRISKEYAELLKNKADDYFSIINWCLDHGYLQQALTLYTECFPYLIVTKDKMLEIDEKVSAEITEKANKDRMNREKEYLLLNEYTQEENPDGYKKIFKIYKEFVQNLKSAIELIKTNKFSMEQFTEENSRDYWTNEGIISWDFEDYMELLKDFQKIKNQPDLVCDVETVAKNLPTLYSFWNFVPKDIFKTPANERVEKILNAFKQIKADEFRKTNSNTLITKYMIMNGVFKLNIDEETFLRIAERYFIIKVERNDIAHARMITKKTSTDSEDDHSVFLKEFMKQGLNEYSEALKAVNQNQTN